MTVSIPFRLANGEGNAPDANKWMSDYDWLTALLLKSAIINGGLEFGWVASSFSNPSNGAALSSGWTYRKSGTSPSTTDVTREAVTVDEGAYSIKFNITGAGSSDAINAIDQVAVSPTKFRGRTLLFGMRVKVATGSKVKLKIADSSSSNTSTFHSGSDSWELLWVPLSIAAGATSITFSLEVTADFTGAIYADGAFAYAVPAAISEDAINAFRYDVLLENIVQGEFIGVSADGTKIARWSVGDDGAWAGTPL